MQLAVALSDHERTLVQALTPTQRREYLMSKVEVKGQPVTEDDIQRQFNNIRYN